jgi:hypothetical protein
MRMWPFFASFVFHQSRFEVDFHRQCAHAGCQNGPPIFVTGGLRREVGKVSAMDFGKKLTTTKSVNGLVVPSIDNHDVGATVRSQIQHI